MTSKDHTEQIMPVRSINLATLIAVGLAGMTVLLYQQVRLYEFVNLDDFEYVVHNPHVRSGLSIQSIFWAFTHTYSFNWHPLTWISHMLDCELFGLNPGAHHMTNLLIHAANTLLLFHVLNRMTKALWRSALVALLFSLHPLHVESVAWISERKDVLSTLFFLLTILAYLRYTEKSLKARYLLVLVLFALGLMAKPMVVTLPFILILLDFWPLGRHAQAASKLLLEKIPLLILSAASCIVTYMIHARGGSISALAMTTRIENGLFSYAVYLWKAFWPANLSCFYLHPDAGLGYKAAGAGLLLLIITIAVFAFMRRLPYLFTGWLWFLGALVPVSGIVQAGNQGMADRYTYIPLIGIFLIFAWGCNGLLDRIKVNARWRMLLAAAFVVPLLVSSYQQIGYWKDSFTLFQREIDTTKHKHTGYTHLGSSYDLMGDPDRAIACLSEALRIMPDYEDAHFFLGNALRAKGDFLEAEKHYAVLLRQNPNHFKALNNTAYVLIQLGREQEAVVCLTRAFRINPDPMTRQNLEQLLKRMEHRSRD